jgi:hypothetical protein
MTGPVRRSKRAAVRAWNEGVTMLRCEDAKAEAARLLPERDEALADALRQLERLATAVAGDAPTEARYGSLWSDLRKAAAEARKVLDKYDGKTERNES